jgi:hypothetical protein
MRLDQLASLAYFLLSDPEEVVAKVAAPHVVEEPVVEAAEEGEEAEAEAPAEGEAGAKPRADAEPHQPGMVFQGRRYDTSLRPRRRIVVVVP